MSARLGRGSGLDSHDSPFAKRGLKSERETKDALHLPSSDLVHHRSCGVSAFSENEEGERHVRVVQWAENGGPVRSHPPEE